jgi:monoamine oxidase
MPESDLTRRRFLGAAVATGAAAAVPTGQAQAAPATSARRRRRKRHADVVVVGGGFAGLTAARQIHAAGKSVLVLEARNRVGGRAHNLDLPGGEVTERGATFIGPTQDHIAQLAREMGVGTFDTYDNGQNVYINGGQRLLYSDSGLTGTAPPDPLIVPELTKVVAQLDQMSTEIPINSPWTAANAAAYDGQTLETWVQNNSATERFRHIIPVATRPVFGAEPRELSLLFVLFYIAASGNESNPGTFERNFNTRGGAQQTRFLGGSQSIARKMRRRLDGRVLLRQPVRQIRQDRHGAHVITDHVTVRAKRVIVAVPPTLAGRIDYHPAMPAARDQLTQRLRQGTLTKVTAIYDRPFWRDEGLSGTALNPDGLVQATFDDSPPSGTPGVVFGFVGGDSARAHAAMSLNGRRAQILEELAAFFGPAARHPVNYRETRWSEEKWTRGCPVGIAGPGTLLSYGHALREPVGRLHWAGTETSTYWNGYMDGAVRSGERAASEVLAAL